jgi:hypothetical protein
MAFFTPKPKKEANIQSWMADQYNRDVTNLGDLRESSRRHYEYVAGDMVSAQREALLKSQGLPVLKLNIILPKIVRLMGAEREARVLTKAVALAGGKTDTAEALTKMFEMTRVASNGWRQIAHAWLDSIICDVPGWLEVIYSREKSVLGEPNYRRINPLYVVWDVSSQRYDLSDASHVIKTWWWTVDRLEKEYRDSPKQVQEIKNAFRGKHGFKHRLATAITDQWETITGASQSLDSEFEREKDGLIRMMEGQIRERHTEIKLYDPATNSMESPQDEKELEVLKKRFPRLIEIEASRDHMRTVTTAGGSALLLQDVPSDVQNGMFSMIPFWTFRFGGKPFGMVKNLEAPQTLFWKEISSASHILNATANPIWKIPYGSMSDQAIKDLEKESARTGYILQFDSAVGEPKRDVITSPPVGRLQMGQVAQLSADNVSGIGPNAVGQADTSGESGKLVETRVGETMAMLEVYFDNKQESERILHEYLIGMIQAKMTSFRVLRWINPDSNKSEELLINARALNELENDVAQGEYGIAIDKGQARYVRQEKFMKYLVFADRIGITPSLIRLIVSTFDDLSDEEKDAITNDFISANVSQQARELEGDVRAGAKQTADSMFREKQSQQQQSQKQLKAA